MPRYQIYLGSYDQKVVTVSAANDAEAEHIADMDNPGWAVEDVDKVYELTADEISRLPEPVGEMCSDPDCTDEATHWGMWSSIGEGLYIQIPVIDKFELFPYCPKHNVGGG